MIPDKLNIEAVLAAVLQCATETKMIKVKSDDSGEEKEVEVPNILIERQSDGSMIAVFPLEKVLHYMSEAYGMNISFLKNKSDPNPYNQLVNLTFKKVDVKALRSAVLDASGKPIVHEDTAVKAVAEKMAEEMNGKVELNGTNKI